MKVLKRLFSFYKSYSGIIIIYTVMGLVMVLMAMAIPMITKFIIASVIGDAPFSFLGYTPSGKNELLLLLAGAWLGIVVLRQIISYLRAYMMTKASIDAVTKMREVLFHKIMWQSLSFLRNENTGNLMSVLTGDTETVKVFFTSVVPGILEAAFGFIAASVILFERSPLLVLVVYLFAVPTYFIIKKCNQVFHYHYGFVRESEAALRMNAQENIVGMRIIKSYAQEENEKKRFDKYNREYRDNYLNFNKVSSKFDIPFGIVNTLSTVMVSLVSFLLIINTTNRFLPFSATMTIAEYVEVTGYVAYILVPFQNMNSWLNRMQYAITCGERIIRILDTRSLINSKDNAPDCDTKNANISLNNVSFSANGKRILDGITVDIPQGKRLGIMGSTGSGKSVLLNIIMRFYDVTDGHVMINSQDVRNLSLSSVRKCFAPVSQNVFLFSDTIKNNIAYGRPDATNDEIVACAKIAQADDFINEFPEKYETIIGERGYGVSGGQKQRLSIARALLFDAPVLIMDDATSALDMETEKRLYSALDSEYKDKTKIIIAHRVSSVKHCDEIIMLDKGKIIERGTHEELLAKKGRYYEIYCEQYSSLVSEEV